MAKTDRANLTRITCSKEAASAILPGFPPRKGEAMSHIKIINASHIVAETCNNVIIKNCKSVILVGCDIVRVCRCSGVDNEYGKKEIEDFAEESDAWYFDEQKDLRKHIVELTNEEIRNDDYGCTLEDPRTGERYMECVSCGMIMDPVEEHHSAGECNFCHAVNKDD